MNELKNIKPKEKITGFEQNNFYSSKVSTIDQISKNILSINDNLESFNLSINDKEILKKIINSLKKKTTDLLIDDFILNQHEIPEIERIPVSLYPRYLIYRYKFNKYPVLKKVNEYPICVNLEPTSICNLRCVMCYQSDKTFSRKSNNFMGNMNMDLFKKIIDEIHGNVEALTLASRGEPTLNQNLNEMLKYCNGKFLGLKLNTNATMLNEKIIHSIFSTDLQTLVFSIDEKDKESYEKIRVNAKFEKTMKNLELFKNIKEKHYKSSKMIVRISGVKINENQNINEMKKQYEGFADQITFVNYGPWESAYDNEINEIKKHCSQLFRNIYIWWDGIVNPCDYDYKSILSKNNINNESIKQIWNSENFNFLREKHINKKRREIQPCNKCLNV